MYKVYGDMRSGNCYKVKLLLEYLSLEHQWIAMDIMKGETQSPEFQAKNPNGKIPLLELPSGEVLAESNAILNFLAQGSAYLPDDALARARVLEWQFFEQYSHEPYIAVARFIQLYQGLPEERREEYEAKHAGGYKALAIMENQLSSSHWLANDTLSIADISLYAYTHVAHEGGFDLDAYPAVQAWLLRMTEHPCHVSMNQQA